MSIITFKTILKNIIDIYEFIKIENIANHGDPSQEYNNEVHCFERDLTLLTLLYSSVIICFKTSFL